MNILILSLGFLPNIGGLETHLDDLIKELNKRDWQVVVLTYQPLNTPSLGKWVERGEKFVIYRLPSIRGLFYKLLNYPLLEFFLLCPLQFLITPVILIFYPKILVMNAQGLISGFSVAFWSKVFCKRYIISTQSVYNFPRKGFYRMVVKWIFSSADKVLAISRQSAEGVISLGIPREKVIVFTHWEDVNKFKPQNKFSAKNKLKFDRKFVVSFFGRLVPEKGIRVLIDAIKMVNHNIIFAIYGEGPLEKEVIETSKKYKNVLYMRTVPPDDLPLHYSAADIVVMPSLHEEGFGRVAVGALLCGTPVVASNRGALPEVIDSLVGEIVEPTPKKLAQAVAYLHKHPDNLKSKAANARKYAIKKFSDKNAEVIIKAYEGVSLRIMI